MTVTAAALRAAVQLITVNVIHAGTPRETFVTLTDLEVAALTAGLGLAPDVLAAAVHYFRRMQVEVDGGLALMAAFVP